MPKRQDYKTKEIPLNGKLVLHGNPTTVGTDFVELKNMRFEERHLENIGGMTKVNTTSLAADINAAFFYQKDLPSVENVLLVHKDIGVFKNTTAIPSQGDFNATIVFTDSAGHGDPRFSSAPGGKMMYCNGKDTAIWGGDEIKPTGYIDQNDSKTYKYNYLEQITNNLDDVQNLATVHRESDTVDSYCKLLMHFENNLTDESASGHTATSVNMAYSNSVYRFGVYSAQFNAINRAFTIPDHADFDFSAGIFTIDGWYYPDPDSGTQTLYYQYTTADTDKIEIWLSTSGEAESFNFQIVAGGVQKVLLTGLTGNYGQPDPVQGWTHFAVVENGNNYYLFINGTLKHYVSSVERAANYTGVLQIGRTTGGTQYFGGYLDELRVSNGVARWTSGFTVPTSAWGAGTYKSSIFIGSTLKLSGINFYTKTANTTAGSATVNYWNGSSWASVSGLTGVGSTPLGSTGLNAWTFTSTDAVAKLSTMDDALMYWYKVNISNVDTTTTIYKVTVVAPMQQITDIWDGEYRSVGSFQHYVAATPAYKDFTSNVVSERFDSANTGTYAALGGLLFANDALYLGSFERLSGFKVSFASGFSNALACTMHVSFWTGSAWQEVTGLIDGTRSGEISFNKSGSVNWYSPDVPSEFKQVLAGSPGKPATSTQVPYYGWGGGGYMDENGNWVPGTYTVTIPAIPPSTPTSTVELYYYKITFVGNGTTTAFTAENGTTAGVRPYNIVLIPAPSVIQGYKFSIEHAQRLWLCNNTAGEASAIVSSSVDTSQVFNGNDSLKQYFGDDSGLVGAATLYSRVATVINNTALFFKQTETWALEIAADGSGVPRLISGSIGCIAPYTIDALDVELSPANYRRVAVWLSQQGVMVSDGTSPICISGDLDDLFDPMDSRYLTAATLSTCRGFIDPQKNEYHLIIPGSTSYVWDIAKKKWYEAPRTATTRLRGGITVYDSYGVSYPYGYGTNYVWRLDNGYNFDGEDIACSFQFGDMAIDEGSIFSRTSIKSTKLIAETLSSSTNNINFYHYGDGATAASTFKVVTLVKAGSTIVGDVKPNSAGPYIFHSFKHSFNVNASAAGFTPVYFGVNYSQDNKDL